MHGSVGTALLLLATLVACAPLSAQATATWYIGTYTHDILVWDEATEEVVDRIETPHPIANRLELNAARTRIYVGEASGEHLQIVDVSLGAVIDDFTLSRDSVRVRIDAFAPHPSDERVLLAVKRYTKHIDRYTVEGPFLVEYDLRRRAVTDTVPWPEAEPRERASFRFSPDGERLFLFTDAIVALDAESHEEVDRWEISRPLEPGLGPAAFDTQPGTYDEPGVITSLLRTTDPVQNRCMLGVARVRMSAQDVDFFTLGTCEPVGPLALAPGGAKAYALYDAIGRYEFWELDLVEQRVTRRHPFPGRPRMELRVSADGSKLLVHRAGATIDVYDARSFELLRTVTFDEDMRQSVVIPGPAPRR